MPIRLPDFPAIVVAGALAPVLLLAPGYFWSRLLDLGPVSRSERACWSLLLSLATAPVLAYNFFLVVPFKAVTIWAFALLQTALPAVLCLWFRSPDRPHQPGRDRWLWIFPLTLALLAVSCVMDVEVGDRLYRGHPTGDYAKHIVVTDAIYRTGVHPVNPAFYPGRPVPLFYYFFWFLLCSMLDGLSLWKFGPQASVQAMTAWAAIGLFALVFVLATRFLRPVTRRTVPICFLLVLCTGLDLLPNLFWAFVEVQPGRFVWRNQFYVYPGGLDTWNWVGQASSWLATTTWVPHHLGALLVGMTGFALVFAVSGSLWMRAFLFACAAVSVLGMSVWVTLVFAGFWLVWAVVSIYRRWQDDLRVLLGATLPTAALALPFLHHLARTEVDGSRTPLVFDVRNFGFAYSYLHDSESALWKDVVDLAFLVPAYFLELGIFFVGGVFWWKYRRPLERPQAALAVLVAVSVLTTSFLRSAIDNNDFGWRGFLPVQLVLVLCTAWMLERLWRLGRRPPLVVACLVLGLLATPVDWVIMTTRQTARDLIKNKGNQGRRDWALRRFYEQLRETAPPGAVVQRNPIKRLELAGSFYGRRQSVISDLSNGMVFNTNAQMFEQVLDDLTPIFRSEASASQVTDTARKYKIDVIVVADTDGAWESRVWEDGRHFRLLAECAFARAYECR